MECLYAPDLTQEHVTAQTPISLAPEEARHARSLRLKPGQSILITSGKGIIAEASIITAQKSTITLRPMTDATQLFPPNPLPFTLYASPLSDSSRFEFIIEKAVELGAQKITLLRMEHSEYRSVRAERLQQKAIAAIKQSKNPLLPEITPPIPFQNALTELASAPLTILGDPHGMPLPQIVPFLAPLLQQNLPPAIIIGPEGGLSAEEHIQLKKLPNIAPLKISPRRLRSETAAVALMSIVAGME